MDERTLAACGCDRVALARHEFEVMVAMKELWRVVKKATMLRA